MARSASRRRDGAHLRPLARVPVSARAEDDDQPPPHQRAHGRAAPAPARPACGRSRAARWRSRAAPRCAPAGRAPAAASPSACAMRPGFHPSDQSTAADATALDTLKSPKMGSATDALAVRRAQGELHPPGAHAHVLRRHVRVPRPLHPEAHRAADRRRHVAPRGVVRVQHGGARGLEQVEEAQLGVAVRLHRPVVVQVVAGQVGEHRRVEAGRGHPRLVQRVRRNLHRHPRHPLVQEPAQPARGFHGPRRRQSLRPRDHLPVLADGAQRADVAGGAVQGEQVAQHGGRRRLAVGPRHAHERHRRPRVAEELGGGVGGGEAAVRDAHLRRGDVVRALLHDHAGRARARRPAAGSGGCRRTCRARRRTRRPRARGASPPSRPTPRAWRGRETNGRRPPGGPRGRDAPRGRRAWCGGWSSALPHDHQRVAPRHRCSRRGTGGFDGSRFPARGRAPPARAAFAPRRAAAARPRPARGPRPPAGAPPPCAARPCGRRRTRPPRRPAAGRRAWRPARGAAPARASAWPAGRGGPAPASARPGWPAASRASPAPPSTRRSTRPAAGPAAPGWSAAGRARERIPRRWSCRRRPRSGRWPPCAAPSPSCPPPRRSPARRAWPCRPPRRRRARRGSAWRRRAGARGAPRAARGAPASVPPSRAPRGPGAAPSASRRWRARRTPAPAAAA